MASCHPGAMSESHKIEGIGDPENEWREKYLKRRPADPWGRVLSSGGQCKGECSVAVEDPRTW